MTDALTLRDLSKTYRNGFQALKGINLTVPEGEFYALLGPMALVNRQQSVLSVPWRGKPRVLWKFLVMI